VARRRADAVGVDLDDLRRSGLTGSVAQVIDKIAMLRDLGATRLYLQVLDLHDLDHLQLVAEQIAPHL
jgi:hypothetical protein